MENKIAMSRYGAAINLHISGEPSFVAEQVNIAFNFGIISSVPDDFCEGVDTTCTVQSDAGRFWKGMKAVSLNYVQNERLATRSGRERKSNAPRLAKRLAVKAIREIPVEPSYYVNGNFGLDNRAYSIGNTDHQEATENVWAGVGSSLEAKNEKVAVEA